MKLLAIAALLAVSAQALAAESVRGHVRKDGTYVAPHYRSSPDSHRWNNYGAQGNTNPYTGERGTQRHELSNPPRYNWPDNQPTYQPYGQRKKN